MEKIILLTGSNIGNRIDYLNFALKKIENQIHILDVSSLYESSPWGYQSNNPFLNQCIKGETDLSPMELLAFLKEIEKESGRIESSGTYQDRSLDIDILFFGKRIINEENLKIPHPRLHLRNFTLYPLAEIAEDFVHPVLGKSIQELLNESADEEIPMRKS
jgi:2-amino-4-hydroxy-6-hydroxymethyldihydropteridine diphosphokinase